jgi:ABC-type phosphate transport system ATPase subunit
VFSIRVVGSIVRVITGGVGVFLAAQGTPGVIVEHGDTGAMFQSPQDQRTSDYVHGRFG